MEMLFVASAMSMLLIMIGGQAGGRAEICPRCLYYWKWVASLPLRFLFFSFHCLGGYLFARRTVNLLELHAVCRVSTCRTSDSCMKEAETAITKQHPAGLAVARRCFFLLVSSLGQALLINCTLHACEDPSLLVSQFVSQFREQLIIVSLISCKNK